MRERRRGGVLIRVKRRWGWGTRGGGVGRVRARGMYEGWVDR